MIGYLDLFNGYNTWDFVESYLKNEAESYIWNKNNDGRAWSVGVDNYGKRKQNNQFPYGKHNCFAYDADSKCFEWANDYLKNQMVVEISKKNQSLNDFVDYLRNEYEFDLLTIAIAEIERLGFIIYGGRQNTEYECFYRYSYEIEFIVTEDYLSIENLENNKLHLIYSKKDLWSKDININSFIHKNEKLIVKIMEILNFPKN